MALQHENHNKDPPEQTAISQLIRTVERASKDPKAIRGMSIVVVPSNLRPGSVGFSPKMLMIDCSAGGRRRDVCKIKMRECPPPDE